MIIQHDIALPTFNTHGGPITHSSIGSKPDSPVHPLFPRLFLARGLKCNSRATFREILNTGIKHNIYSRCFEPLSCPVTGIERLPARSKLPMNTPLLCSRYFLKFQFESTLRHLPRCYRPDSQPCRGPFSRNTHPLFFRKYDGVPEKKGC